MTMPSDVPFVSPANSARWAKALLVANVILCFAAIVSGWIQVDLISRVADGAVVPAAEAAASDERQKFIGMLQFLIGVGIAAAFLVWFHRMHNNLPGLGGRELKYSPGWAVGGFFVPILDLVRPFQVMREVWHGSDPAGLERDISPGGPAARNALGAPPLVGWWWGLFVVMWMLGIVITLMARQPDHTVGDLLTLSRLLVASDVLDIPAALVTIRLIDRLTGWQAARRERIGGGGIQAR